MALKKPYIGQMDKKIKIYRPVLKQNEVGEEVSEEELFSSPWAQLIDDYGEEKIDMAVMHSSTRSYVVRYRSELFKSGEEMIIEDRGKRFQIVHVSEVGTRSHLRLRCVNYE